VVAAAYTLLNERLMAGKPTVISTNLTISEILERYSPQIASPMQGNFRLLPLVGQDIRILKNR
jgi:DNA replication protein DnaC